MGQVGTTLRRLFGTHEDRGRSRGPGAKEGPAEGQLGQRLDPRTRHGRRAEGAFRFPGRLLEPAKRQQRLCSSHAAPTLATPIPEQCERADRSHGLAFRVLREPSREGHVRPDQASIGQYPGARRPYPLRLAGLLKEATRRRGPTPRKLERCPLQGDHGGGGLAAEKRSRHLEVARRFVPAAQQGQEGRAVGPRFGQTLGSRSAQGADAAGLGAERGFELSAVGEETRLRLKGAREPCAQRPFLVDPSGRVRERLGIGELGVLPGEEGEGVGRASAGQGFRGFAQGAPRLVARRTDPSSHPEGMRASDPETRVEVVLRQPARQGAGREVERLVEEAPGEEVIELDEGGVKGARTSTEHSSLLTWPGRATVGLLTGQA